MYPQLGLNVADRNDFHNTLRSSHSIRIQVQLLKMDGTEQAQLDNRVIDGQVNIDVTAAVTRSATVTLLDPNKTPVLDSDSPGDGALYLDRMIRIWYGVRITGDWVDVPIFTGPLTKLDRSGPTVSVEAQGKELLAAQSVLHPLTLPKGMKRTDAIRILMQAAGENRFDLPDLSTRLANRVTIGMQDAFWPSAQKLAHALDRQLFYDGRGVLRLRNHPGNTCWTFRDGDGGTIIAPTELGIDASALSNVVHVRGRNIKGKHGHVHVTVELQEPHALAPARLGRNGVKRYLNPAFIDNEHIRGKAEALKVAKRHIKNAKSVAADVTTEALVIPHLEEGDQVRVETEAMGVGFRLRAFSIPLTTASGMTIGFHRMVSATGSGRR